jgi:class 3 adenylate cyclase
MARLRPTDRESLPDSAFAYVDAKGRRRLPINDEPHVRNALARFNQVKFESDAAREQARTRLLRAAKKYGIVPVGFITGQIESERAQAASPQSRRRNLPEGRIALLMTDIEGSSALVDTLGSRYERVLAGVRREQRAAVARARGSQVDVRADEFFAVFATPVQALRAAIDIQRAIGARTWPAGAEVKLRVGVHAGEAHLTTEGYIGLAVHLASRLCAAAHGGQILVSGGLRAEMTDDLPPDTRLRTLGRFRIRGIPQPEEILQVAADGLAGRFPPPRSSVAVPVRRR